MIPLNLSANGKRYSLLIFFEKLILKRDDMDNFVPKASDR